MSNFINIHVLISHSPSCLNRDDMNMQKDAIFGGKRRVRISSQSLKRAMRKSDYYAQNIGESSLRTIHLAQLRDVLRQKLREGANKWGNSSRLTQSFHFFMFEPI
ncbi:type I-E CRISPR-associated protein Cas7/Cse4/CasC, partial [Escherichia coli]